VEETKVTEMNEESIQKSRIKLLQYQLCNKSRSDSESTKL